MAPAGWEALRACAQRSDLSGLLARQMLWEARAALLMPAGRLALIVMALTTAYFAGPGRWRRSSWPAWPAYPCGGRQRRQGTQTSPARRRSFERIEPPLISIVVPARNEELMIVESVRALLALDYDAREIVVVNDGSSDERWRCCRRRSILIAAPLAYEQPLVSARVRSIYRSASEPALVVVDKDSGGCKADAANAGINAASGELVLDHGRRHGDPARRTACAPCCRSSKTVAPWRSARRHDRQRLHDRRRPHHATCACRPAGSRGCRSSSTCARSCSTGSAWRLGNALLILSGAFGLFRRDAVIAVGGYDRTAIGEDMDLTLRLQRHFRRRREPFRIVFDPNPICWTQAPEDWISLRSQRWRWRRGLLQVLWRHRGMIGNPRYGLVGIVTLPYTVVFEGLAPLLEFSSYANRDGHRVWRRHRLAALLRGGPDLDALRDGGVDDRRPAQRRRHAPLHARGVDLVRFVIVAFCENYGYRQLNGWWGAVGTFQAVTGIGAGWGTMKRRSFHGGGARRSPRRDAATG
jgi:GT2 family glycosyltransferase